jgi:hypothetical protein
MLDDLRRRFFSLLDKGAAEDDSCSAALQAGILEFCFSVSCRRNPC